VTIAVEETATEAVSGGRAEGATLGATEERIVSAALRLIGRRGVRRLSMQDISEAAGVSRGTLYRYFPNKDLVIAAAAAYDETRFAAGLAEALTSSPDPLERIRAFIAFSFDYIRTHESRTLFETEPEFVLGYLLDYLPRMREAIVHELGEALDVIPVLASGETTREQLADVIVRLFASSWLIAESDERMLVHTINHILLPDDRENAQEGTHGYHR
jgi:AcrR family transcriptional regulator